ncbi:ATP phosphoribosyltransferase (ATP-PRTase) (ATP-PRT) [Clarireedia jacksonii]
MRPTDMYASTDSKASLEGRLLFAVPKKGRLLQKSLDLLQGADIQFHRESRRDISIVKNLPIALIFLPAADIPTSVSDGRVDLGITGRDQVAEHDAGAEAVNCSRASSGVFSPITIERAPIGVEQILDLGFGGCRLQVQVPEKGPYAKPADLIGKNIGTSFVSLTKNYFTNLEQQAGLQNGDLPGKRKLKTKIVELSGSVEAACALGVADGIVDLVESGETMRAAGLKPIDTVVSSTAILIKSRSSTHQSLIDLIQSRIAGVIAAQQYVLCQYNVLRSKLDAAAEITPGRRSPTINFLKETGWVAVSAMVEKKNIATVMDNLTEVGATDIIILDISSTRI